ncbi:DDE superfamily endonuclease [Ceratobasidium sp. AG-Ba]|nr:DDE superfamily endonuclease [Ceratobasidium sp. AG-Ba]
MLFRKIGPLVNVHPTTASRIYERNRKTRSLTSVAAKSGRPRILSDSDAKFTALSLARGHTYNVVQLWNQLFPHVSVQTVRRNLKSIGIRAFVRHCVPLITRRNQRIRLEWCQEQASWTLADWARHMYSDEKKFNLFGSDGRHYTYRTVGKSMDPCYTKKTVKHGGGSVMTWGCVTWRGVGRLVHIHGTLTSQYYTEILKEGLLGTLKDMRIQKNQIVFQQDNDPKHTSQVARDWLSAQSISVLPWPAQSPDLNIIEHVWSYVDRQVHSRCTPPKNLTELWEAIKEEWYCVPQSLIDHLYESIPERVQAVIDAHGGNTRY